MKKLLLSLVFICSSLILQSQIYYDFYTNELSSCFANPSEEALLPVNLEMYQTKDNTPTGEIDSNICVSLLETTDGLKIDISQVDIKRALFIRHKVYQDFENIAPLEPNSVYSMNGYVGGPVTHYIIDDVCENNDCSKFYLSYTVPSEDNSFLVHRTVEYPFTNTCDFSSCLPTQKFESGQFVSDVIMQLYLSEEAVLATAIKVPGFDIEPLYEVTVLQEDIIVKEEFYDGTSTYSAAISELIENNWANNYLLKHNLASYPSEANRAYIEFYPEVNKVEPQIISIFAYPENGVHFQDYTSARAGLVEGSDSVRHQLDLQVSSSQCIFFVELVVGDGSSLSFREGGNVDLFGTEACLQLRDNARMKIMDRQEFFYSGNGKGNLALAEGGNVFVEDGSTMNFNGNFVLLNNDGNKLNDQVYITLPFGSTLNLGKETSINTNFAKHMKLDIYMNGGSLNLEEINNETREKINLIYPENSSSQFSIFPNPSTDKIIFNLIEESEFSYTIYSSSGHLVKSGNNLQTGEKIDIQEFDSGLYYVQAVAGGSLMNSKFIVTK